MKFKKLIVNILETTILLPLTLIGAILLVPFIVLGLIIDLPLSVVLDIWMEN